jgi:hypothetical protein
MRETLLLDVPHRQIVFTIPKRLRVFFKFNRRLLGDLCRCALRSLSRYFEMLTGSVLTPGVIAAIQTFGDRINLHVHLHFLVTEGGVDAAGVFHKIPRIDDSRLAEIFAREVLRLLVGRELLNPEWAKRILSWPHTGFNVYEVDPMICSKCGGRMKVVAFITEHAVVDRIIGHLKLTFAAEKPPQSRVLTEVALTRPPREGLRNAALMAAEESGN